MLTERSLSKEQNMSISGFGRAFQSQLRQYIFSVFHMHNNKTDFGSAISTAPLRASSLYEMIAMNLE